MEHNHEEKNVCMPGNGMCKSECGSGCGCGCGHGHKHLIRWIIKIAVLVIVFSFAFKMGELKGMLGGRGYMHNSYQNSMMGGYYGYGTDLGAPDTTPATPVAPVPAK